MDIQRLMAATAHSSLTIQQALSSPLIAPDARMQPCKRLDCRNTFTPRGRRLYCLDPNCRYIVLLEQGRVRNARKKARGIQ